MKIVHLASAGAVGGAEWVILDILGGLRGARPSWPLALVVPRAGALAERAAALDVDVSVLEWKGPLEHVGDAFADGGNPLALILRLVKAIPSAAFSVLRLRRALRAIDARVIHAHGFKMQLLSLWARPRRAAVVLHLHDYVSTRPAMSRLLRLVPMGGVRAVAISSSIATDARRVLPTRVPVTVVYNGIDLERWAPIGPTADLDALAGVDPAEPGTIRVGLVATMARWKGHETFLRALAQLPRDMRVRGYVIGGPIYQTSGSEHSLAELKAMSRTLDLDGRVGFTGLVADPSTAMRALDVIIHASIRDEPFGRVIAEGMALGRPVITSATGGGAELIVPGVTALTFPPGDAGALAERITELVENPSRRHELGENGTRRAHELFDRARMTSELAALYESIAGSDTIHRPERHLVPND